QKYHHRIMLNGHMGPINCVRFSSQGPLLASGGDDGYIFIWSLPETQFTHKFHAGQGPIVALEWFDYPNSVDVRHLVSAGADGTIKLWKLSNHQHTFIGMHEVHEVPIENVALHYNKLAIVGGCHLTILNIDIEQPDTGAFTTLACDPEPPSTFPALARTVHFINLGRSVIVGHLDAKTLSVWNVSPWKKVWIHRIATRVGNAAWCESTQTLLVWNLCDGIDIYRIDGRPIWIGKLAINISRNMVVQVSFGVEPFAISGSDRGDIYIWDLKTRSLQQVLRH
ncbi:WD40-repeat-containing domain protein, partial [Amanita rubescens]